jgi:crotonobetainyl-CoA:carnitine CoA-transferase CaiB-like acyl-CoA transferase
MSIGKLRSSSLFSDLIVLDLSTVLAGPSVGTFFAELGAKVIKIEHPINKDVTRSWKLPQEDANSPVSAYFSSINYKKEYVELDLLNPEDKKQLNALLENADVLISNFKRSDYERFDLTNEALSKNYPKLIHGRISGYGTNSDRAAYDLILQAESGFMSMNGTPESGPIKMPVALIDVLAAHHLKEGILCALIEKAQTGKGSFVSVSLLDAAISSLVNQASNYLMSGQIPQRIGSLHPNIAPYGELFVTADSKLITFAIGSDTHFLKLCSVLEISNLTEDVRFNHNQNRVANRSELAQLIQEKVKTFDSETLLNALLAKHVPAGEVKSLDRVFESQSTQEMIREENIEGYQTKRVSAIAFRKDDH